jgi:hypothetical protein
MTHENASAHDIISRLDSLLEAERAALIAGDMDSIPEMLERKTRLIDDLNGLAPGDRDALDTLKSKVMRNQALLDGALQGISAVAGRLAALRRLRDSFDTYDESGRRQTIDGDVAHRVEKRA